MQIRVSVWFLRYCRPTTLRINFSKANFEAGSGRGRGREEKKKGGGEGGGGGGGGGGGVGFAIVHNR